MSEESSHGIAAHISVGVTFGKIGAYGFRQWQLAKRGFSADCPVVVAANSGDGTAAKIANGRTAVRPYQGG